MRLQKDYNPFVLNYFKTIGTINSTILADYIIAARRESNISDTSRKEIIKDLFTRCKFFACKKSFKDMSKDDILSYLGTLRKPDPSDPLHK